MTPAQAFPILAGISGVFLVGVVSPGPNFMFVTSQAARSRRVGLCAAAGYGLAAMTWSILTTAGFGALAAHAPWAPRVLQWLGAGYQLYFGLRMLAGGTQSSFAAARDQALTAPGAFGRGYAMSVLNPKSAAFYSGVLAQMLPKEPPAAFCAAVALALCAVAFGWYGGLALGFSVPWVRCGYARIERPVRRLAGVLFLSLAARAAIPL
jgi:threonine/homoserine/homoserine lactone efflux protein